MPLVVQARSAFPIPVSFCTLVARAVIRVVIRLQAGFRERLPGLVKVSDKQIISYHSNPTVPHKGMLTACSVWLRALNEQFLWHLARVGRARSKLIAGLMCASGNPVLPVLKQYHRQTRPSQTQRQGFSVRFRVGPVQVRPPHL